MGPRYLIRGSKGLCQHDVPGTKGTSRSAERCRDRLLRAREEAGVEHVFLFPAHTLEGGGDMPAREVDAFRRVIGPAVRA